MHGPSFVILHGLDGSGPGHWQPWLAGELRRAGADVRFPDLPDACAPDPGAWGDALARELADLPEPGRTRVLCHSLACILWLRALSATRPLPRVQRVLLVAPPSPTADVPQIAPFFDGWPLRADPGQGAERTLLVCSEDDPYCPEGASELYGAALEVETMLVPGGGHLNADAGFGAWPWVLDWCLEP